MTFKLIYGTYVSFLRIVTDELASHIHLQQILRMTPLWVYMCSQIVRRNALVLHLFLSLIYKKEGILLKRKRNKSSFSTPLYQY